MSAARKDGPSPSERIPLHQAQEHATFSITMIDLLIEQAEKIVTECQSTILPAPVRVCRVRAIALKQVQMLMMLGDYAETPRMMLNQIEADQLAECNGAAGPVTS